MRAALEFAHFEQKLGHNVSCREPSNEEILYGTNGTPDLHVIHSQLSPKTYGDGVPKIMLMHGEPISSVGNKVSMKAICDLANLCDAFICMRAEELAIWKTIKRACYRVPKGVDLERYKPLAGVKKLEGSPAVVYCENWRGERNPLVLCVAMSIVHRQYPDARLHLFNCSDPKMLDTFRALWQTCHWWPFLRTISGPVEDVVQLYNSCDVVASCLYPLYARTAVESLACGAAHIGPGYRESCYPFTCQLEAESMAEAIISAWNAKRDGFDFRQWAVDYHDAEKSTTEAIKIYERHV